MIKLHLLNEGEPFKTNQVAVIRRAFGRAVRVCKKLISADKLDIVVSHNPALVMTETGIGGKTHTPYLINIPLDARVRFDPERLYLTMCHEMHHAMRRRKFGFPKTLFDAIVSEGLAEQFEIEINPQKKLCTNNRVNTNKKELLRGLADLKKERDSKNYNYYGWFFGQGKYPKYFGYVLGSLIVKAYLNTHTAKPSKLVSIPTRTLVPYIETARRSLA